MKPVRHLALFANGKIWPVDEDCTAFGVVRVDHLECNNSDQYPRFFKEVSVLATGSIDGLGVNAGATPPVNGWARFDANIWHQWNCDRSPIHPARLSLADDPERIIKAFARQYRVSRTMAEHAFDWLRSGQRPIIEEECERVIRVQQSRKSLFFDFENDCLSVLIGGIAFWSRPMDAYLRKNLRMMIRLARC